MDTSEFYVGVTDNQWFEFLSELQPDEVNFWLPGSGRLTRLQSGTLFLFKLHSPLNVVAGGGFVARYMQLPLSLAWEVFQTKNGVPNFQAFREKILSKRSSSKNPNPEIGCVVLAEPFFFQEEDWIDQPTDWRRQIVRGKYYSLDDSIGLDLWHDVQERLQAGLEFRAAQWEEKVPSALENMARYGAERLVRPRLGQGAFRAVVTDAYHRRCAVTRERVKYPICEDKCLRKRGQRKQLAAS